MSKQDTRWKQRFQNLEKAFLRLQAAVKTENPSDLEKAGIIQIYEFTFELAWKTVKDFLEENQVSVKFPRDTIKEGFKYELLDGEVWMDMLEKRNLMSHTYDEEAAELAYNLITTTYYNAIQEVYAHLKQVL
ncbi:nucleotidyltransferase substrate binding protein [Telluribacter sp.]|jgi:nucleotidyltransferase substrate binding protein (TIGR01987 family)|uniref:nucleotidyltransferase substrate binding protein n=1 Tax=Telluribacter sp. TaxID=1978767 RepID=UPI002E117DAD|nr:nucleotidyltransferase substrate binding protein [Telluribacter sp.]